MWCPKHQCFHFKLQMWLVIPFFALIVALKVLTEGESFFHSGYHLFLWATMASFGLTILLAVDHEPVTPEPPDDAYIDYARALHTYAFFSTACWLALFKVLTHL